MVHESLNREFSPEYDKLHGLIEVGTLEEVRAYLKAVPFCKKMLDGALMFSVLAGAHVDKTLALVEAGAGLKGIDIAIISHVAMNDLEAIKKLVEIKNQASTGVPKSMLNQAAQTAAAQENMAVLQYFIDQEIDLDADEGELIFRSCAKGNLLMVQRLVEAGANIHASQGRVLIPAVESALKMKSLELVQYLVDECRITLNRYGSRCLQIASEGEEPFSSELMFYLVNNGVPPGNIAKAQAVLDRKALEDQVHRKEIVRPAVPRRSM